MAHLLRPCLGVFAVLTLVTGVAYPILVTTVAQLAFPARAAGSVLERDGRAVGSTLLGQSFSSPGYFWGRPSATVPQPYNSSASGGTHLAPTNPALASAVAARVRALRAADPDNHAPAPIDLVTASGSGLDPHISPAAAAFQVLRVARSRGLPPEQVSALVSAHTHDRLLGLLGEPHVNVVELNLALDEVR
jgi:K+-transporting ATPase ATPase C chain